MQAFLISGVPGAGKSTVARALAAALPRSAHIEGDLVGDFIISGFVPPQGPPEDEAHRQLALRRHNTRALADSFAAAGFVPVVDDVVVSPSVLTGYLDGLQCRPLLFVQLAPSLDVVAQRDAARHKHFFDLWKHLDAEMRSWPDEPGLWLDTSRLTVAETVSQILARSDEAVVAR